MKKRTYVRFFIASAFLLAFVLWTVLVLFVDVQAVGPQGSAVGFAAWNARLHQLTGVHMGMYTVTDWLGLVPIGVALGFAICGLVQWVQRKDIRLVDRSILFLGLFYILVMAVYILFEYVVINYRPILINGYLEASYPSSTTMLVLCVMPTAMMQLSIRIRSHICRQFVLLLMGGFIAFMVIGRLLSGVHWFSDILGGVLVSTGLVALYAAFTAF